MTEHVTRRQALTGGGLGVAVVAAASTAVFESQAAEAQTKLNKEVENLGMPWEEALQIRHVLHG